MDPSQPSAVVMDLRRSPASRLEWAPVNAVTLGDGFWRPRLRANRRRGIPCHLQAMEEHGFLDNFRRVSGRVSAERRGRYATDADVGKWLEAACWALASEDDAGFRDTVNAVISDILAAQGRDGYLNTWYVFEKRHARFSQMDASHELFNAGHLTQAAIAHFRTTGDPAFLDAMDRYADYLGNVFDPWRPDSTSGHDGYETALVELYRTTGRARRLDLARFLLDWAGFTTHRTIEGHCVRTAYRCCGATDYVLETGDAAYREALDHLWNDMVRHKIHLHGGIGSRFLTEDFGAPYQLPTRYAYAETCAAIGNVHWNARMLSADGGAPYADLMERILYNGFLAAVSLRGGEYFYVNALASDGQDTRAPWTAGHYVPCCLPNVLRMMASIPGYFYGRSREGLWIHLYDNSTLEWSLEDGRPVRVEQETGYPWTGTVNLTVDLEGEASLFLRVPAWCRTAEVRVLNSGGRGEGDAVAAKPGTYCQIQRNWRPGARVQLTMAMPPERLVADPRVRDCAGCAALQRGPLVYCLEGTDNPGVDVLSARLAPGDLRLRDRPAGKDFPAGMTAIEAPGRYRAGDGEETGTEATATAKPLYFPQNEAPGEQAGALRFIPYFAWANRGATPMTVWLQRAD